MPEGQVPEVQVREDVVGIRLEVSQSREGQTHRFL